MKIELSIKIDGVSIQSSQEHQESSLQQAHQGNGVIALGPLPSHSETHGRESHDLRADIEESLRRQSIRVGPPLVRIRLDER